jgi:phage tail sheath protein FI
MVITNIKTPGVYVDEIPLFPPSVAQVATAIPAFIGYTQMARDTEGNTITQPVRIKSLLEFNTYFGGAYQPSSYTVKTDTATLEIVSGTADKRFHLYDCLRQYYDNGGGDCYIVSVGRFTDGIDATTISGGIESLRKYDEPTLIVFPDGVELTDGSNDPDVSSLAGLHQQALALCASMQDRFSILDIMQGNLPESLAQQPIKDFRDNLGINFLNYGAAYYPWIITNYDVAINFRQLTYIDEADAAIANIGTLFTGTDTATLITELQTQIDEADIVTEGIIHVDEVRLRNEGANYITEVLTGIATNGAATTEQKITDYLDVVATLAQSFVDAESGLAPTSNAQNDIARLKTDEKLHDALVRLVTLEKAAVGTVAATHDPDVLYADLDTGTWFGVDTYAGIVADGTITGTDEVITAAVISAIRKDVLPALLNSYGTLLNAVLFAEKSVSQRLFQQSFFKGAADKIKETMRTVPPSGAAAGIYAMVDRTRGVWKAPANVSLNGVIGPVVKIDNLDQEDLNVHDTGKSINAIRAFTGKGTLVWGARTLAGNDNEWRYVPVRRFFIMVEESVKKASEPFVFEPNDANTWIKVKVMIENFLTLQWRAGALQGAKPEQAFFVNVGLGSTMSEIDILEGRMIVEIGMAVVRPAEFIILRFSHKMME